MPEPLLRVSGLSKHFPLGRRGLPANAGRVARAVDGVSFTLDEGEILGVVGESGCGKTTLARLILRLIEPTEGDIWFDNEHVTTLSPDQVRALRLKMQIVFQDPLGSLNPRMRVGRSIGYALSVHNRIRGRALRKHVEGLLERVGLRANFYDRLPHQLSGGQRQRIGIARALAVNPKLIVADEPVAALDLSAQAQVLNLFKHLQKDTGSSYIVITHDLSVASYLCDRILVMYGGQVVEIAATDQIFAQPQHPYTQALISAAVLGRWSDRGEEIVLEGDPPNPASPPSGCRFHPRCPAAGPLCRRVQPKLAVLRPSHAVACHAAQGTPLA
jgi:peptide/nickel transport system ATP-binding protein